MGVEQALGHCEGIVSQDIKLISGVALMRNYKITTGKKVHLNKNIKGECMYHSRLIRNDHVCKGVCNN